MSNLAMVERYMDGGYCHVPAADQPKRWLELAHIAYAHAASNYDKRGARYDVIVECMEKSEIAERLESDGANTETKAREWADEMAGLQHEVELNQAWDGPESCIGSKMYNPAKDPDASNYDSNGEWA